MEEEFYSKIMTKYSINNAIHWRAKTSQAWYCLFFFIASALLIHRYYCSILETLLEEDSVHRVFWIPDTQFGYTVESLHAVFDRYGVEGRKLFVFIEILDSLIVVPGYILAFGSAIEYYNGSHASNFTKLSEKLPIVLFFVDHLENTMHIYCSSTFDRTTMSEQWGTAAVFASTVTKTKWLLLGSCLISIVVLKLHKHIAGDFSVKKNN